MTLNEPHQDEQNKNIMKVANKAAKVHGSPKIPKYKQHESSVIAPDLPPKARKNDPAPVFISS